MRLRSPVLAAQRGSLPLPVFNGGAGLVAGIDPLSNKALGQALDDDA